MSSHHIVRDDQEPALIIANGASCQPELLGQLLEWSPLVVVLDSAIERVMHLDIKIDVLLGDFDRDFDPEIYKTKQYPLEIVHTPDQNKTDFHKSLEIIAEKGFTKVDVFGGSGGEMDHFLGNLTVAFLFKNNLKITFFDEYGSYFFSPKKLVLNEVKGKTISLYPFPSTKNITTIGLQWPLNNEHLELTKRIGTRNVAVEEMVTIHFESGDLVVFVSN